MPSWLARQLENVERDSQTWPDWKKRECGIQTDRRCGDDSYKAVELRSTRSQSINEKLNALADLIRRT